jgi:transcription initiation factor TFIIB
MSLQNVSINSDGTTCPSCKGKLVSDQDKGERICSHCAIVIDEHFCDANSESANFFSAGLGNESIKEPTSLMMYYIGLPTLIGKKNVDASGKQIQGYYEIEKLRRLNKFTISGDSKTRNLNKAIREIHRICEVLGISHSIAERASYIYRKALNRKLIRGRSITGIVAATIYIACKDAGILFPIDRIESLFDNCNRKSVIHYYKLLLREMKINVGVPDPAQYISKIAVRARLSGKTERKAFEILSQMDGDLVLSGKKPVSLAAASLYLAALQVGEHVTQLRIAIASELTTITIRKICLEINQILKQKTKTGILSNKESQETVFTSHEIHDPIVIHAT